jgi:transcriptional regulator with XRE-family HTH domain
LEDAHGADPGTKYPRILSAVRQRALGEFLRKHRETVHPADEGRPGARRRRTSGLRREEVAQLARISPTWYTRLEQGQEVKPSGAALGRIADVLQLAPAERAYLFEVAQRVDPKDASSSPVSTPATKAIESCVLAISFPALVVDKYWTLLSWNTAFADLFAIWIESSERNVLRYMFLNPGVRTLMNDWEFRARRLVAHFRVEYGKYIDDPKMLDLLQGLSEASDHFRQYWEEQEVLMWEGNEKSFNHPQRGWLTFFQMTFLAAPDPTLKLIILQPKG